MSTEWQARRLSSVVGIKGGMKGISGTIIGNGIVFWMISQSSLCTKITGEDRIIA